jgi:hypothetical protein
MEGLRIAIWTIGFIIDVMPFCPFVSGGMTGAIVRTIEVAERSIL